MSIKSLLFPTTFLFLAACQSAGVNTVKSVDTEAADSGRHSNRQFNATEADRQWFIQEHDLTGDGQVSLVEFVEFRQQRFDQADVNGDGLVDADEYVDEYAGRLDRRLASERRGHQEQTRARFNALDRDKNGVISWEEFKASGDRIWERLDAENQGVVLVDPDEKTAPRGRSQPFLAMPTTHRVSGFMALYDEEAEGRVTRESYERQRRAQFDEADADGNGVVDLDEYLNEFMARVDRMAEQVRTSQLRQARVRFGAVDLNNDGGITPSEYLAVGLRSFQRWDVTGTGVVSASDPLPGELTASQVKSDASKTVNR